MFSKFNYDFYSSYYDNIMRYVNNKDYWDYDVNLLYEELKINNCNMTGINRKKWKIFLDYIKLKIIYLEKK